MKIGLSSYSLLNAIKTGEMTVLDAIQWIADNGGEHMEIVPYGFTLVDNAELADAVREKAETVGIELSNYSMPANFVQETELMFDEEIARVKQHVDLVNRLGMKHMRHDVTAFTLPPEFMTIAWFEASAAHGQGKSTHCGLCKSVRYHDNDRKSRLQRTIQRPGLAGSPCGGPPQFQNDTRYRKFYVYG